MAAARHSPEANGAVSSLAAVQDSSAGHGPLRSERYYRRLFVFSVACVSTVAILPTVVMTAINYHQYQEALHDESLRPVARLTANAKLSLEAFLAQRMSVLALASRMTTMQGLSDAQRLQSVLRHMKVTCGGFIDLGVITEAGQQVAYAGPYQLEGKDYSRQDWFQEVTQRGVHVSDVFMGHRNLPHFVIAVRHDGQNGECFILRATIDTEAINRQILSMGLRPGGDAFIVNRDGILQTPSRYYGKVLQAASLSVPPYSPNAEVLETQDRNGEPLVIGYAYVDRSPFILMMVSRVHTLHARWFSLRRDVLLLLGVSIALVLVVVVAGAKFMVNRTRESDQKRAAVLHNLEYTAKMAAIGRLAAGVAHEINNPLAIINQKAGLIKDKLSLSPELPAPDVLVPHLNSVLNSVERCKAVTHRLLGFAKHMDVEMEQISLEHLLQEVLGFLEREASYRRIQLRLSVEDDLPRIESDRGQLQQVFLNLLNNAIAAVEDGGQIEISIERAGDAMVEVSVVDNGIGIPEENLKRIFEPFFTTKKASGTGLGLSITYGIVQKLGGDIRVASELGKGSRFTVLLPVERGSR
jgi:two-component system NtrC family sensor kinase